MTRWDAHSIFGWDRPTRAELPDELDKPDPPLQVRVNGWMVPAVRCPSPSCTTLVPAGRPGLCADCADLYREQTR